MHQNRFSGIAKDGKDQAWIVKVIMEVKEETDLCASWKNVQEVSIKIDPLPVKTPSLEGKKVYDSERMTIMIM